MRNARLLVFVTALVLPLFWTGALWAAEEPVPGTANAVNLGEAVPGGGIAPEPESTSTTEGAVVIGTVVGTNCWLSRGLEGDQYRDSAVACARSGTPLTILTDAGELVYPITVANSGNYQPDMQTLMSYAEQRVAVTGKVIKRGKERAIVIDKVASAPEPKKKRTFETKQTPNCEVVGRVVDLSGWIASGSATMTDPKLVGECAAGGDPLVIVARGGRVYYPVMIGMPKSPVGTAMLSSYCAQQVRVTGTIINRGGGRAVVIDKVAPLASK